VAASGPLAILACRQIANGRCAPVCAAEVMGIRTWKVLVHIAWKAMLRIRMLIAWRRCYGLATSHLISCFIALQIPLAIAKMGGELVKAAAIA